MAGQCRSGVSDALPLAIVIRERNVEDFKPMHLKGQYTIVLVNSLLNRGRSLMLSEHNRGLNVEIRLVI